jgi:hypothetical protein
LLLGKTRGASKQEDFFLFLHFSFFCKNIGSEKNCIIIHLAF